MNFAKLQNSINT
jgi:hypothetical protein